MGLRDEIEVCDRIDFDICDHNITIATKRMRGIKFLATQGDRNKIITEAREA